MAGRHLSLRIEDSLGQRLEAEAHRTKQTTSELARELIEEGLRMRKHPGIVFRDGPTGRRAGLTDGVDVWEAVRGYQISEGEGEEQIANLLTWSSVNRYQLVRALRYYEDFPDEIDERIALNDAAAREGYAEWLQSQPQTVS